MSLLNKLTIVIPTYGRPAYILRNMQYWSGKACRIIVMDGSPKGLSSEVLTGLAQNVSYFHRATSLNERLLEACTLISTPYSAMLCDDDFFSAQGLELAIAELEADVELVCCGGNCASFCWKPNEQKVSTRTHYPEQSHFLLNANDPAQRTIQHFRHYTPAAVYAVHRTYGFKLAMKAASHINKCIYSAELAFEFVAAFLGKMKTINTCYWLRSLENEPVNVAGSPRAFRFHHWLQDPAFKLEVESWYSHVSSVLEPTPGIAQTNIAQMLQSASQSFLAFSEEYFAGQNRADKGVPGSWLSTSAIFASRDIRVSDEILELIERVTNFHQQQMVTV